MRRMEYDENVTYMSEVAREIEHDRKLENFVKNGMTEEFYNELYKYYGDNERIDI